MNFRLRNNNEYEIKKRRNRLLISSFIIIFLIIIFSTSFGRSFLFFAARPLWSTKNSFGNYITNKIELLRSKESLISENDALKIQIEKNKEIDTLLKVTQNENSDLKDILDRKSSKKVVLAAVLVKPPLSPYDTLIIDVGEGDGIQVGDKVLADGNIYIGYIKEVYGSSAKVVLYSSSGEKVKVLIGENNILKEAEGLGAGNFSVEVPVESGVKEGDNILIPSISANVFGVVEKIDVKKNDSIETLLFKSSANLNELKWVEVIQS
jgi:cell shape-determining protein MreC